MNIKNLDDLLTTYVSEMQRGKFDNLQNLWQEIEKLFDVLENPSKDNTKKNEIKQIIHSKLQNKTLDFLELKTLTRDLVFYQYA
ncbi:hypothetical protein [Epilithonimonas hominis]|uniref:hypothetical protein n=1 Tax=Epilithonimonas hominis TaxID=420404 RepID=UPI002896AB1D|nr:hypothetical protein [Epilithonimonas hominis]